MSRFITYCPTPEDVSEAFRRSQEQGVLHNSLTRGNGRMVGFLGEIAFEACMGGKYVGDQSFAHDFEFGDVTVDVKSKVCTSAPRPHYAVSVFMSQDKPLKADIYFFVRVMKNFSKVWLVGWAPVGTVQQDKYYRKKGDVDEHGFKFIGDGYHLPINKTRRPDSFQAAAGE